MKEKQPTEINCDTVRELKNRGLHREAYAMVKEHQRQFKEGMNYARKRAIRRSAKIKNFRLMREGICVWCRKEPVSKTNKGLCEGCRLKHNERRRNKG